MKTDVLTRFHGYDSFISLVLFVCLTNHCTKYPTDSALKDSGGDHLTSIAFGDKDIAVTFLGGEGSVITIKSHYCYL